MKLIQVVLFLSWLNSKLLTFNCRVRFFCQKAFNFVVHLLQYAGEVGSTSSLQFLHRQELSFLSEGNQNPITDADASFFSKHVLLYKIEVSRHMNWIILVEKKQNLFSQQTGVSRFCSQDFTIKSVPVHQFFPA